MTTAGEVRPPTRSAQRDVQGGWLAGLGEARVGVRSLSGMRAALRPVAAWVRSDDVACPWQPLTQAECDEFLRLADPNGDGKISYEEFKNMECWKIPDTTVRRPPPKRQADAASSSGES